MSDLSTWSGVEAWLGGAANFERQGAVPGGFSLARMAALAARLGLDAGLPFPVIHVAGTKGKGTTCAAAASLLDAMGKRVGLYTSPHLVDARERIRIGARPAPDALLVLAARPVADAARALEPSHGAATYFELVTALALEAFRLGHVDAAVLEVGLGGRLDATNVVTPAVTVITRIARDHVALLGETTSSIAAEKAGILKPFVPCVAGPGDADAERVIAARAAELGCPLWLLGRDVHLDDVKDSPVDGVLTARARTAGGERVISARMAPVVAPALALALAAVERAFPGETAALDAAAGPALARLRWRGRWDVLPGAPTLIVDGAHCEASLAGLVATCRERLGPRPPVVVLASSRDKDHAALADVLQRAWGAEVEVTCCAASSPRAMPPADLAAILVSRRVNAVAVDDLASALARAEPRARGLGVPVLVTGSLFLAGEALALRGEDTLAAW